MDDRAAKLALARKRLKDHQEKKSISGTHKGESSDVDNIQQHHKVHNKGMIAPVQEALALGRENESQTQTIDFGKHDNISTYESNMHITELLICNERNLEIQVKELQTKVNELESENSILVKNLSVSESQIEKFEADLKRWQDKCSNISEELLSKNRTINELLTIKSSLTEAKSNLQEQLEFTKAVYLQKEGDNSSLQSQLEQLQNQLEVTQLKLQQLNTGNPNAPLENHNVEQNDMLIQKISALEQQLVVLQKEKQQMSLHYEHYVSELNQQLQTMVKKSNDQNNEILALSNRENSLVDQIGDMEIRLQNFQKHKGTVRTEEIISQKNNNSKPENEMEEKNKILQDQLKDITDKYVELQTLFDMNEAKVMELTKQINEKESQEEPFSLTKLNADIASDKLAAQRATEQNKKLKVAVQELEEAFVKMSQDKLELTEKLGAEKFLNRELTIKLAEIEEKSKEIHSKIKAKDEEMMRLQSNCRDIERKFETLLEEEKSSKNMLKEEMVDHEHKLDKLENKEENNGENKGAIADDVIKSTSCNGVHTNTNLLVEDAMGKLQERFLKIMGDVAELSDEKHRLEHIILQLQNETDTICEYVALYQQQRSLLKKRDEERSSQIKIFQMECDQLKSQLEEISGIIIRIAEDRDLISHFQTEPRHLDLARVMELLSKMKNSSLVDPKRTNQEFKDFYPCACCSGQLIDI